MRSSAVSACSSAPPAGPRWTPSMPPGARRGAENMRRANLVLRRLSPAYVAALCRPWRPAGWTPADVLLALEAAPARPSSRTSAGRASLVDPVRDAATRPWRHEDAVRHVPGWFAARLAPWRTDPTDRTSPPGRSPTERREAARRHQLAVRRAARDREARLRGLVDDQGRPTAAPGPR